MEFDADLTDAALRAAFEAFLKSRKAWVAHVQFNPMVDRGLAGGSR